MSSILKPWVEELGLRHQGVLLSWTRGCDGFEREDASKHLNRFFRACILNAHVGDPKKAVSFMLWWDHQIQFWEVAELVLADFDKYPTHYLMHMIHATEILGYKMPVYPQKYWWEQFYLRAVKKLHLYPEDEILLDERLNANEEEFKRMQA